ncbi:MAG: heme-copper oxidase subunit III, partial [Gemmatimonadota bacterium]
WTAITLALGILFLAGQLYDYSELGFGIADGVFGTVFFTLTGFHGAHVTAGVIWLGTLLAIDYKRGLQPSDAINVDIAALYWHFVDVVWIAIFTLLYLIPD